MSGEPIKGRCGTCDWPTNSLPCPYCAAVARAAARERSSRDDGMPDYWIDADWTYYS